MSAEYDIYDEAGCFHLKEYYTHEMNSKYQQVGLQGCVIAIFIYAIMLYGTMIAYVGIGIK